MSFKKSKAKPKNGLWGLSMWIVLISSLSYMIVNDDWRNLIEKKTVVDVFLDKKQCENQIEKTSAYLCGKSLVLSDHRSELIVWPYENENECKIDFGSCSENNLGYWKPFSLGFAIVRFQENHQPFPIYYSIRHGQYILSSGYPVKIGRNSFPYFTSKKEYLFNIGGKLSENICFPAITGENICQTRNEMIKNPTKENRMMLMHSVLSKGN